MIPRRDRRKELTSVVLGPLPVSELRHLTTGRIYLKPLQKDIEAGTRLLFTYEVLFI